MCKETLSAWSLSACLGLPLGHPPQPDPVQPGNCSLCLQRGQSVLTSSWVYTSYTRDRVCAVRPEGPWTTDNRRLDALHHSQSSQAEPGKYPAAAGNRSEIVERCSGNKGVIPDREHGEIRVVRYTEMWAAPENKTTTGCTDQRRANQGMGLLLCTRQAGREALYGAEEQCPF